MGTDKNVATLLYNEWLEKVNIDEIKQDLLSIKDNKDEIEDRFYRELEFGTGGLRGKIAAGTNRMNYYTVSRATFGLASYIIKNNITKKVVIAYDSRNKSYEFAFRATEILSSFDIEVYIFDTLMPTPVLSFSVRHFKAGMGIVITASHNPKEYNGYKVYNENGCQITDVVASQILREIQISDYFTEITKKQDKIHILGEDTLNEFLSTIKKFSLYDKVKQSGLKIVYTPLHGTGNIPVRKLLSSMGADVIVVKEQELPDSNFTTCPYPNPEEKDALVLALKYAKEYMPDLVFGTDPDADRIGIAVPNGDDYILLNGNETGLLMMSYMLSLKKANGNLGDNPTIIKTIVTSDMAFEIAKPYGAKVKEVLTGFKYIGEELDKTQNYVMGLEESCGYLVGDHARDKDAVSATMIIVEMCAYYKAQGKSLYNVLQELYNKYGYYKTYLQSIKFEGITGMTQMREIIDRIRSNPFNSYNNKTVEFTDFSGGVDGLPKSNVLRFRNDEIRMIIRPSGTEPKLKIYYQVKGNTSDDASIKLQQLIDFGNTLIK